MNKITDRIDRITLLTAGTLFVTPWLTADLAALILLSAVLGRQMLRPAREMAPAPAASLD